MKPLKFRAWTGKQMMYQEQQYLASFIRRVVLQINLDSERGFQQTHEAYLPDGKSIDDYLMLFTGFHDANGKDIYEGDIMQETFIGKVLDYSLWEVRFEHGAYGMFPLYPEEEQRLFPFYGEGNPLTRFAIIGNVYETPELLKGMRT